MEKIPFPHPPPLILGVLSLAPTTLFSKVFIELSYSTHQATNILSKNILLP